MISRSRRIVGEVRDVLDGRKGAHSENRERQAPMIRLA